MSAASCSNYRRNPDKLEAALDKALTEVCTKYMQVALQA